MASSTPRQTERGILLNPKQHIPLIRKISKEISKFDDVRTLSIMLFDGHDIDGNGIFNKKMQVEPKISIEGVSIYVINEWIEKCPKAAFGGRLLEVLEEACPIAARDYEKALVPKEKVYSKVGSTKRVTRSSSRDDTLCDPPPKRAKKDNQDELTDTMMFDLQKTAAATSWKNIGRRLRKVRTGGLAFTNPELDMIDKDYDKKCDECLYQMILKWKRMSKQHGVELFRKAMDQVGIGAVAEQVFDNES